MCRVCEREGVSTAMLNPETPKRRLAADLSELESAFEDASWEMSHYLDLETGQIVTLTDEIRRQWEDLFEDDESELDEPIDLAEAVRKTDLPEWEKDVLIEADQIEAGYGTRYLGIPQGDSHEGYRDMEAFITTIQNEHLRDRLWQAIGGGGAFRNFKDVLADFPRERERWFEFKDARLRQRVLDWLASQGIEPAIEKAAPAPPSSPAPSTRARLITETLAFVRAASQLPGILRIALIGSLAAEEQDPKDVDLLVTVADDTDLKPLASLGRRLAGHAQSFNRGGDVFLADARGHYLGRTCPWRDCRPGLRQSCDALQCGQRPYLHDDLKTIDLAKSLIAAPPIELWPQIVARLLVPKDVEQNLMTPLGTDSEVE
jgi:hypothetical protein